MAIRAAAAALLLSASAAAAFELGLPADCEPGRTCFLQQYFDHDPGRGAKDYMCGGASYDGHDGTDLRIRTARDAEAGTSVLAAAAGTVIGLRDGMPDRLLRGAEDKKLVANMECGNGVLIEHEDGWQTQYCHMLRGSVAVAKGQAVKAGEVLGKIGYSGAAAFPHVHVSVRKDGKAVDPFRGLKTGDGCGLGPKPLWSADALSKLAYKPGEALDAGFAGGPVDLEQLELGSVQAFRFDARSPALVAWGWAVNLQSGDEVIATLEGPTRELARSPRTLDRNKATYMAFAGKKRPAGGWPAGRYVARFEVNRDGRTVIREERTTNLP